MVKMSDLNSSSSAIPGIVNMNRRLPATFRAFMGWFTADCMAVPGISKLKMTPYTAHPRQNLQKIFIDQSLLLRFRPPLSHAQLPLRASATITTMDSTACAVWCRNRHANTPSGSRSANPPTVASANLDDSSGIR
jgi:hypothetical protein